LFLIEFVSRPGLLSTLSTPSLYSLFAGWSYYTVLKLLK